MLLPVTVCQYISLMDIETNKRTNPSFDFYKFVQIYETYDLRRRQKPCRCLESYTLQKISWISFPHHPKIRENFQLRATNGPNNIFVPALILTTRILRYIQW